MQIPEFLLDILNKLGSFALYTLLPAALIFAVGVLVIRLVMKVVDKLLEKAKIEKAAYKLIRNFLRAVLYILLLLMIASKLGVDVTGIVALASVLTLAISLSIQNLLTNLVSGFTLLYTKPFVSGDIVEVAGQTGTVDEIGLTYTKLITPDNKTAYIPNSSVTSAEIVNYTVLGTRRIDITVSASYDTPIEQVLEALREAGKVPTALDTPAPFAAVSSYGESAIVYVLQVWTNGDDYWTTLFDTNKNIKTLFEAKGVQFTFPHLNIHVDK